MADRDHEDARDGSASDGVGHGPALARRYVGVITDPRTWRIHLYASISQVVGIVAGSAAITAVLFSLSTIIVWVGLPLLALTLTIARAAGMVERARANALLGADIKPPAAVVARPSAGFGPTLWAQVRARLTDAAAWRQTLWLVAGLAWGTIGFLLTVAAVTLTVVVVAQPVWAIGVLSGHWPFPSDPASTAINREIARLSLLCWPLAVLLLPAVHWVSRGYGAATVAFAHWALGPTPAERLAAARDRADVAETRVRLDQELHDSIGHQLTMTVVQAGAGAHVFDRDPQFARQALLNIEERGRTALAELDRIITGLGDGEVPWEVQAGLAELPALVEDARRAGLTVNTRLRPPRHVDAALGRAVYAVAREALTNAARHAPGSPVDLTLVADRAELRLTVGNPVPGAAGPREGRGLAGARRRVALTGGRLDVSAVGGEFVVAAVWPVTT